MSADRWNEALEAAAKACEKLADKYRLSTAHRTDDLVAAAMMCSQAILALREAEHEARGWYTASRVKNAPVFLEHRARGVPINSSWIDEAGEGETESFTELWGRILEEIRRSQALFLLIAGPDDFPLKGALVEVGMALALGKRVYVECHVELEGRTMRPLGSWIMDKKVTRVQSFEEAIACEADQRGAQQVSTDPLNAAADPQSAPHHPGRQEKAAPVLPLDEYELATIALRAFGGISQPRITFTRWKDGIDLEVATDGLKKLAQAIMQEANPAPASPGPMVMVPREPTEAMLLAAQREWTDQFQDCPSFKSIYRAMLAAAPRQALASSDPEGHLQAMSDAELPASAEQEMGLVPREPKRGLLCGDVAISTDPRYAGWVFVRHVDGENWTTGAKLTPETWAMLVAVEEARRG